MNKLFAFLAELQRRHVYKVGAMYAVAGWLLVQMVTQVLPVFNVSLVSQRTLVLIVIAGMPITLILSWLFDLTPDGIVLTESLPRDGETPTVVQDRRSMDRKLNYVLGGLLVLSLAYVVASLTLGGIPSKAEPGADNKSVAVLPFESLSDDKANAYFAEGIQDEILTRLANIGDLKVISRTSTVHYASRPEDLPAIAHELGVANVLEGSVQRAGDAVHINVQLIQAASDAHLWAQTYDRKMDDVFGVEGEVAQDVAGQLKAKLSGQEQGALSRNPTQNTQAYEAYLRGLSDREHGSDRASMEQAITEFERAFSADPSFADALVEQASTRFESYLFFAHHPADLATIKQEIDQALQLQPDSAKAWWILGKYRRDIDHDYPGAGQALDKAHQLSPNNSEILLSISKLDTKRGDWDEGIRKARRATELDPLNRSVWHWLGSISLSLHRYHDADTALTHGLAVAKDKLAAYSDLVALDLARGDLAATEAHLKQMPLDPGDLDTYSVYSDFWRRSGRFQEGIEAWNRRLSDTATLSPEDLATGLNARGELYACAGDKARAKLDFSKAREGLLSLLASGATNREIPGLLGPIEAYLGMNQEALALSQKLLSDAANDPDVLPFARMQLARVEAIAGDHQAAIRDLSTSLDEPDGIGAGGIEYECNLDMLRNEPEFQALLARAQKLSQQ